MSKEEWDKHEPNFIELRGLGIDDVGSWANANVLLSSGTREGWKT